MWKSILYYSLPGLKVLLFLVLFVLCCYPFLILAQYDVVNEQLLGVLGFSIFSESVIVFIVISALLMVIKIFKEYDFENMYIVKRHALYGFAKGTGIGLGLLCLCSLMALISGNVSFELGKTSIGSLFGYLIFYILVGIFEEFLFRTFPLKVFAERYPTYVAIFLTSIFFGLAHLSNPGFTWIAMVNITLAGVLFAILILIKQNVYWAVGVHFGWNFAQGALLGYKVSGTHGGGILKANPVGPVYLSGGDFGIENSIFCTIVMLTLISILFRHYKLKTFLYQTKE